MTQGDITHGSDEEEGEKEKRRRRRASEGRQKKVLRQNGAATALAGDLYRIISPSECLHF